MTIRCQYRALPGVELDHHAMLIVPLGDVRVGHERLDEPRTQPPAVSDTDREILRAMRTGPPSTVSVFCAQAPDDVGSWGFHDQLGDEEVDRLAERVVEAQMPTLRAMFLAGHCMHVRIGMGAREQVAIRRAQAIFRKRLEHELGTRSGPERELAELDVWLLRNFIFSFAVSVNTLLGSTLGTNPAAIRMRMKQAQRVRDRGIGAR